MTDKTAHAILNFKDEDTATEHDKDWFASHPDVIQHLRLPWPQEAIYVADKDKTPEGFEFLVLVTAIGPGLRLRCGLSVCTSGVNTLLEEVNSGLVRIPPPDASLLRSYI